MVDWGTCDGRGWCLLLTTNWSSLDHDGVYVIWTAATAQMSPRRAVYVGQGNIRERLNAHADSAEILGFGSVQTPILATWASSPNPEWRNRVERYLADFYRPFVGKQWPPDQPLQVNVPF